MRKSHFFVVAIAALALLASAADEVSAASKKKKKKTWTYEQAWQRCQSEVNKIPADQIGQRHARGSACMLSLGHRI